MTPFTEDNLYSDLINGKAVQTLITASVRTLKLGYKKCSSEAVSKFVNNFFCNEICKDLFNKIPDSSIESQSEKCNIISSWEYLRCLLSS